MPLKPRVKHKTTKCTYSLQLAKDICMQVSSGMTLNSVCKQDGFPDRITFYKWLYDHEEFMEMYNKAIDHRAIVYSEEIMDIADEEVPKTHHGYDNAAVNDKKLRVESRKWVASKLMSNRYGDKVNNVHSGGIEVVQLAVPKLKEPGAPVSL